MIWILEFALIVLFVGGFILYATKVHKNAPQQQLTDRVKAYLTTIRRTQQPAHLNEMSDTELVDVLTAAAQKLDKHHGQRMMIIMIGSILTLVAAIVMAMQVGIQGFAIAALVGALATYGVDQVMVRNILQWFERQKLDPVRLEIS